MRKFAISRFIKAFLLVTALYCSGEVAAWQELDVSESIGTIPETEETNLFNPSSKDLVVLEMLGDSNPNSELAEFYEQEEWKENRTYQNEGGPNIGVVWNNSDSARITSLFIKNQFDLTSLNLNGLDSLQTLTLSYNIHLSGKLDLSYASSLKQVTIDNSQYFYSDISFPESFDKSQMAGTSFIRYIGTPRDEQSVKVPDGTTLDFSPYVTEGTTLSWTKNGESVTLESIDAYRYTLTGTVGDYFVCTLQNEDYPNWMVQTLKIYLDAGEVYYNEQDYKGLLKLADDNPQTPYLQDLFKSDDWKNTGNSIVKLQWNVDGDRNARLTKIEINPEYNETADTGVKKLDLSAFSALRNLTLHNLKYVDSVDVSGCSVLWIAEIQELVKATSLKLPKNGQLYQLRLFGVDALVSLDLSDCTALDLLYVQYAKNLTSLDLTGCQNLKTLMLFSVPMTSLDLSPLSNLGFFKLGVADDIEALDLSALINLKTLYFQQCKSLKSVTGLEELTSLESLTIQSMDSSLNKSLKELNFSALKELYYSGSDLTLPNQSQLQNLKSLGLPKSITSLDLNTFPNLEMLETSSTSLHYSQLQNYRSTVRYSGTSYIELPGAMVNPGEELRCVPIDTKIDLSSEVNFAGKPTHFIWFDLDSWKEETDLFVEDANTPGLFTIDPNVPINQSGRYECRIWNEAVAKKVSWGISGWVMYTERFQVVKKTPCNAADVAMLQKIVDDSTSEELKEWWNSGQWKEEGDYHFTDTKWVYLSWNDNGRLEYLDLIGFENELTGVLDLSQAEDLVGLYISYVDYQSCVFPADPKLRNLNLMHANIEVPSDKMFPDLRYLDLSPNQKKLDLSKFPVLKAFSASNNQHLLFSNVILPPDPVFPLSVKYIGSNYLMLSEKYVDGCNYYGEMDQQTIDFSSETNIGAKVVWEKKVSADYYSGYEPIDWTTSEDGIYQLNEMLKEHKQIRAVLTHEYFPQCYIYFYAAQYTEPGDANMDGQVNVLDIAATLPYVLNDWENKLILFGFCQADMDANQTIDVADVVGIVNLIQKKATSSFRSTFVPNVYVTSDTEGNLYVNTPVPLAGVQLTITGVDQEFPLLGEAARFAHAYHASDSLCMVAYSMDDATIPAGRTLLAQLPKGATLVEALFADRNAQSLRADVSGVVTATEEVLTDVISSQITNYPNPFHGQTTFTYGVPDQADQAVIRIYAANGSLVRVLSGLPAVPGENQYRVTIDLPSGFYPYRLEVSRAGRVISTQTNNLIIK